MPCGVGGNWGVEDDVVEVMDVGGSGGGRAERAWMASLEREKKVGHRVSSSISRACALHGTY